MASRAAGKTGKNPSRTAAARHSRPDRTGTIPERLTYLFETVKDPNGRRYSAAEVARQINASGGEISSVYILKIRNGERSRPAQVYLDQLATFFGVSSSYFTDQHEEIQDLVRRAALLSPRSLIALSRIVDSLLEAEGRSPS